MKQDKFKVVFTNGREEVFYCNSFFEAAVLAMADAIHKGQDMRIEYITHNYTTATDVTFPQFRFL
jgi:hypothetical protein